MGEAFCLATYCPTSHFRGVSAALLGHWTASLTSERAAPVHVFGPACYRKLDQPEISHDKIEFSTCHAVYNYDMRIVQCIVLVCMSLAMLHLAPHPKDG